MNRICHREPDLSRLHGQIGCRWYQLCYFAGSDSSAGNPCLARFAGHQRLATQVANLLLLVVDNYKRPPAACGNGIDQARIVCEPEWCEISFYALVLGLPFAVDNHKEVDIGIGRAVFEEIIAFGLLSCSHTSVYFMDRTTVYHPRRSPLGYPSSHWNDRPGLKSEPAVLMADVVRQLNELKIHSTNRLVDRSDDGAHHFVYQLRLFRDQGLQLRSVDDKHFTILHCP